jgi:hypothetical protein
LRIAISAVAFTVFIAVVLFRNQQTFLLLLLFVAVVVVLLLWKVPQWQVARSGAVTDDNRFDRENEARKTLAQIIGGGFVLAGLYSSVQTFDLAREGQITDRYTKAIEQLGAIQSQSSRDGEPLPRLEMRLGGIYALERIAQESERDRGPILEVLMAYIRTNSISHGGVGPLRQDIQAILDVITKQREGVHIFNSSKIDLNGANLSGANLRRAYLVSANLSEANLSGANFIGADLEADLRGADLRGAHLSYGKLFDAILRGADLRGVDLVGSDLRGANLDRADLREANLGDAKLSQAGLFGADLREARNLTQQQIQEAFGNKFTKLPIGLTPPGQWLDK